MTKHPNLFKCLIMSLATLALYIFVTLCNFMPSFIREFVFSNIALNVTDILFYLILPVLFIITSMIFCVLKFKIKFLHMLVSPVIIFVAEIIHGLFAYDYINTIEPGGCIVEPPILRNALILSIAIFAFQIIGFFIGKVVQRKIQKIALNQQETAQNTPGVEIEKAQNQKEK